ncbi:MAG: ATP-binding protein, partial [Mollicutes bacterium]|nr:ATP-binding protein [Mollicutes bacterium]
MFGKIKYISDDKAFVELIKEGNIIPNLMNLQVIFESDNQRIIGEVKDITEDEAKIQFLGEFEENRYIPGVIRKPALNSNIRVINKDELSIIVGKDDERSFLIGRSPLYENFPIYVDLNTLFSNHMAIFGNSGSGKSWGVARLIQNIFENPKTLYYNANLFFFDAYGEYKTAFKNIKEYNQNYQYKFITTTPEDPDDTILSIPFHLLELDDLAILLQASEHSQLPILERALKLAKIFSKDDEETNKYKNHLIAKGILSILFSNQTSSSKKNDVFKLVNACSTNEFNYNAELQGIGYTRKFSEAFNIDSKGNFGESVLINEYVLSHIDETTENIKEIKDAFFTIDDFAQALEFTLISEGFQSNDQLQDAVMILKVRLNTLINSPNKKYFEFPEYISADKYISYLVAHNNRRSQIININLQDIDDTLAKT